MRKRRSVEEEWFVLLQSMRDRLAEAVLGFGASQSVERLTETMTRTLLWGHTQAAVLGRKLAGNNGPEGAADRAFARAVMLTQQEFLARLVREIAAGKYGPLTDGIPRDLARRLEWWVRRLRGTAEEAWVRAAPPGTLFRWHLGHSEHCDDCVERATHGPYTIETLPGYPGDGSTECGLGCHCWLEMVDPEGELLAQGFKLD